MGKGPELAVGAQVYKLQELRGGQCAGGPWARGRLVWDKPGAGAGAHRTFISIHSSCRTEAMERSLNCLLRTRRPVEGYKHRRRRSFQDCQAKFSKSTFSPAPDTFLINKPVQNNDTKALPSSQTHYLLRQDRWRGAALEVVLRHLQGAESQFPSFPEHPS